MNTSAPTSKVNISPFNVDFTQLPNFQNIQDMLAAFLTGDNPLVPMDINDPLGGLRGLTESSITDLLQAEGLPEATIQRMENALTSRSQAAERDALRRSQDVAAGRGLFDSGLAERSERDIGQRFNQSLMEQLSQVGFQNALHAASQRQLGVQGAGLLGNLGLQAQSLGIQGALGERGQDLNALSTGIGQLLGLGNLEMSNAQLELQRQLEEFRLGLLANSLFSSGGPGDGPGGSGPGGVPDWIGDWLMGNGFQPDIQ